MTNAMTTIAANHTRDDLTTVALFAYVAQDTGEGCDSDLLVVWADETLPVIAALDAEEQVGAIEAIEQAFCDYQAETSRIVADALRQFRLSAYVGAL